MNTGSRGKPATNAKPASQNLLGRILASKEGSIAVYASLLYMAAGTVASYFPALLPISDFYIWFCFFMPVPLSITCLQMGVFKKNYESDRFNIVVMYITAFIPFIALAYAKATH